MGMHSPVTAEMFEAAIISTHSSSNLMSARDAESSHIRHGHQVEQAIAVLHELTFSYDENRLSKECVLAQIGCTLAMLTLSSASYAAVERFIAEQIKREYKEEHAASATASIHPEVR